MMSKGKLPEWLDMSDEENARRTAAALADPDAQPWDGTGPVVHARDIPEKIERLKRMTRGPQRAPVKVQTTLRLDGRVVEHFKRGGRGWQTRINDALAAIVDAEEARTHKTAARKA